MDRFTYKYYYQANGQLMTSYNSELYNGTERATTLEEQYIYGSNRIGALKANKGVYFNGTLQPAIIDIQSNKIGKKRYELTNHLGNVLATISDRKIFNPNQGYYEPVITMKADYYAFGMLQPGRFEGIDESRHLFNGMEHDMEISGEGNSYTTEFRQYDPRLGRWKSLDPLMAMFPNMSPYVGFANNPIFFTDPYGLAPEGGEGGGDHVRQESSDNYSSGENRFYKPVEGSGVPKSFSWKMRFINYFKGDGYKNKANSYATRNQIQNSFIHSYDDSGKERIVISNTELINLGRHEDENGNSFQLWHEEGEVAIFNKNGRSKIRQVGTAPDPNFRIRIEGASSSVSDGPVSAGWQYVGLRIPSGFWEQGQKIQVHDLGLSLGIGKKAEILSIGGGYLDINKLYWSKNQTWSISELFENTNIVITSGGAGYRYSDIEIISKITSETIAEGVLHSFSLSVGASIGLGGFNIPESTMTKKDSLNISRDILKGEFKKYYYLNK